MAKNKLTIKKQRSKVTNLFLAFLRRFHLLLFFILVAALLSVGVVMLNETLTDTSSQEYTPTISAGSIDQATLERVQSLHTSANPTDPTLPGGRVNPFAE